MRVGAEDAGHRGQAHLGEHLGEPLGARVVVALVIGEDLAELGADLERRVQRAGRVLRHIGDLTAAQMLQVLRRQREDVLAVDDDLAATDDQPAADVAEQRERHRGLAGPGFAHQAEHLARLDLERDLVDHVRGLPPARRRPQHLQIVHHEPQLRGVAAAVGRDGGHETAPAAVMPGSSASSAPRPTPSEARATASVSVFVPMVRAAISSTGASTPHGLATRPIRFSLIM